MYSKRQSVHSSSIVVAERWADCVKSVSERNITVRMKTVGVNSISTGAGVYAPTDDRH